MDTQPQSSFGWLSGLEIKHQVEIGGIIIEPFNTSQLNPNSYNYRLSPVIKRLTNSTIGFRVEDTFEEIIVLDEGVILHPGECYLGSTEEVFGSDKFASLITGRSSVGRKFVTNHVTAGLIDVGFHGQITLEIVVAKPTKIYPEVTFGQIFWFTVAGIVNLYSGEYSNQAGATLSRIHTDTNN